MSVMPGVSWRPVVNHGGAMNSHLGLVLHVCQGNNSEFNRFNTPSVQASSTWWVSKTGVIEQYVDSDLGAWAQAAGNYTYNSVETEGFVNEPLTDAQILAVAHIYMWGMSKYKWPLTLANVVGQKGLAYHGMGGIPWGDHPGCPGTIRTAQRTQILVVAGATMALTQADVNLIWAQPIIRRNPDGTTYTRTAIQELADAVTLGLEFRAREPIIDGLIQDNSTILAAIDKIAAQMLTGPIETTVQLTADQVTQIALAVKAVLQP